MKFIHPKKVSAVTVETLSDIIAEAEGEREDRGSRSERIAMRVSPETLEDIKELANTLGMRSTASDRVMLPDVIKVAVALANQTVNG